MLGCGSDGPQLPEPPPPVRADELVNTGCPPLPPISGFVGRATARSLLDGLWSRCVLGCGGEAPQAPEPPPPIRADELVNTGCPPLPPISGFVGRADGALLLNGITPYRATGTNLYYLQQLLSYAQQEQDPQALEAVREVMDDLVCLSLPVARIWGFNDSKDTSSIRRSPWEGFREEGLRGLDQAVWEAKRRGIRLILPLVNNWGEYGGLPAYAAWASKLYGSPSTATTSTVTRRCSSGGRTTPSCWSTG